jgi:hypothetical protein
MTRSIWLLPLFVLGTGCSTARASAPHAPATAATAALRDGDFVGADQEAKALLARDHDNPSAALVRAVTRYRKSMHQLSLDVRTIAVGGAMVGLNQRYLTSAFEEAEAELARVEEDLAIAARDPKLTLDLCVACWDIDWNGNGRVDERDRLVFQIEQDADGRPIPDGDPRRKPTFRFDAGDVSWARAFVAFQRAALDLVLAYDFSDVQRLISEEPKRVVIRLRHPERVQAAKQLLLDALGHSLAAREAYLRETDDEREWMPNPRQKDHPLPLPVDDALYETWRLVVGDLERLVRGEEGLAIADLQKLDERHPKQLSQGYVDVGRMLREPKDIVLDLDVIDRLERSRDVDGLAKSVLGSYYVRSMKRSPLPDRLMRMQGEVERGEESLERKLRYLLWVN